MAGARQGPPPLASLLRQRMALQQQVRPALASSLTQIYMSTPRISGRLGILTLDLNLVLSDDQSGWYTFPSTHSTMRAEAAIQCRAPCSSCEMQP